MSATERRRDEYGRAFYALNEVPPATEHFAHWRGRLTHPSAWTTVAASPRYFGHTETHDRLCVGGWIPSGEWWLHCGACRPEVKAS